MIKQTGQLVAQWQCKWGALPHTEKASFPEPGLLCNDLLICQASNTAKRESAAEALEKRATVDHVSVTLSARQAKEVH